MPIDAKSFDEPDEVVHFKHGRIEVVTVGSMSIGRETWEPGYSWADDVRPVVGTEWCESHHTLYVESGTIRIRMRTGETRDVGAGEVVDYTPGHEVWVVGDTPAVTIDVQGGFGWTRAPEPGDRILTTVLFTDIVGSTTTAERLGDRSWKQVLGAHHEDIRQLLGQHRGRLVDTAGDGVLATFDAPARAITCAIAIATAAKRLGIEIRAGVHTGEVEVAGDDLRGVAVHLAARLMSAADPGTTFVSATTRDLTIGAGLEFIDRGARELKGISGEWRVFEARVAESARS
ncbi:MAG TPA: adenylate/guanylate cyclase domain-containing protein [Candidatus Limnocylindrales bacterium]|jgi:class 3 adenylate cyclase|nr:adenylate/guanylate cyclase domain-containing protein [Candidatus Limnocylindrales bacterium]